MREDERYSLDVSRDATIAQLLRHLQHIRRSIPVNEQLKAELKARLLQRMKELEHNRQYSQVSQGRKKRRIFWWLSGGAVALTLAAVFTSWASHPVQVSRYALLTLPGPAAVEQVDIDTDGTFLAYIDKDENIQTMPLQDTLDGQKIDLHPVQGRLQSLAWAHDNRQLAVVEQVGTDALLWVVDVPNQGGRSSSRLVKEEKNAQYRSPNWSPDNRHIAFTRIAKGREEIWITSTVSRQEYKLTEGSQPAWSPDGQVLAFVKDGRVSLMRLGTGEVTVLGSGAWPSWNSAQRLTYITREGTLAEVRLDVQPPITHEMPIANLPDDKLERATWAWNKHYVLLTQKKNGQDGLVFSLAKR